MVEEVGAALAVVLVVASVVLLSVGTIIGSIVLVAASAICGLIVVLLAVLFLLNLNLWNP